jgi:sialic acid synthase SpsE
VLLDALVLPREAHPELVLHARERGIEFLSSPFDEGCADFLEELGVVAFKAGSGELTNHSFLRHVARKGRPFLISTGMATMVEVAEALQAVRAAGDPPVALFHCVTNYPAAPEDCNLACMANMRSAFRVPTGWSDHTEGIFMSLAAVALGADLIEKHFTEDRSLPGPDHLASVEPNELGELVRQIRALEAGRGNGIKAPRPAELPLIEAARRSLHSARALPAGHTLSAADFIALRPGTGISPVKLGALLGRRLSVAVQAFEMIEERHLA